MQSILQLEFCFRVNNVAVVVGVRDGGAIGGVRKPQALRRSGNQTRLQAGDCLVDQVVDRVDNVVNQRLGSQVSGVARGSRRGGGTDMHSPHNSPMEYN